MEPRPPRPRSTRPFEPAGSTAGDGIGERLYPLPGEGVYPPSGDAAPPGAVAQALLPRRQRRQRGVLRGVLALATVVAAVALVGWFFRDAVRGLIAPPPPPPTPVVAAVAEEATPDAAPVSGALPNALATVTPTPLAAATATPRPEPTAPAEGEAAIAARDRDISAETLPLLDLLPTQEQMPPGLVLADEAERSKTEVVGALGGTDEASRLLDDWGWSGNAFRDFIADETAPPVTGTTFLNVSVHRFADAAAAANAMTFFSDYVINNQGLENIESPAIGDGAVLLIGAPDGVPLAVLYAQQGSIMYRIGGSSSNDVSDPSADVLAVAATIIPGQATDG